MLKKILLLLFTSFLLCGCSQKQDIEEITFLTWGSITEVSILKNIISNYEKTNPKTKINLMHIPQNYFQKLHLLIASKTAPDVIFINNLNLPIYKDFLLNLDDYVNKKDFLPVSIEALSINNKLYAIPRDISNLVLYINLDLSENPNKNWTINDLYSLAKKINSKNIYGISYEEDVYWALPYLTYFGGGILNPNLEDIFNTPETKQGLEFYKHLKESKVAPNKSQVGNSTLAQMFINEEIGIYLSGRWIYPKIKESAKFNWTIAPFPQGKSPQYADASGWAISKNSKHKEAALQFVKYISSDECSKYFTETGLIVPAKIKTTNILLNDEHNQKIFIDVAKNSIKTPVVSNYKKIVDNINLKYFNY